LAISIKFLYFRDFCSKAEKYRVGMNSFSVDGNKVMKRSDEAMKQGDEALNASSLQFVSCVNASLLQCYEVF
jgi:hypothetical protein